MSASLESLLHAFSNLFFKLNSKPEKSQKRLTFCEDEVKASLDMASKALEQKNHVIHALQLKLSELANEVEAATFDAATHPLSVGSPAHSSTDFSSGASSPSHSGSASLLNASLLLQLQETSAKLQRAEVEIINKDKEISRLSSELCTKEVELLEALSSTAEQESAVQEVAYMLAAREASHGALIDTVHAFVSQNVSSLPPTPRDSTSTSATASLPGEEGGHNNGAIADAAAIESAKKLETMVSFWQERLEAHVAVDSCTLKSKEHRGVGDDVVGTDLDVSFSNVVAYDDHDDTIDDDSCSNSDGDTVTPPTDRKLDSVLMSYTSTLLGPVTPI
ncbi:hypothetical protein Ndes2526B_g05518 [Nannochloris sp. 'desiccata']|nr:hypothetical protein KSW81_007379 [Chlorella desiccata (nom. nud.)]KAH7618606.1 hypothetical protein NADE_005455 [Chlorella desiccata (nom. nud.)]